MYGVRYQAQSPDADIVCPDFKAEFLTAFSARLSLTNVFGQKLTVSPALSSELVLKSTSYSFLLSSSINLASPDLGNLQTALATAWNSAKNGMDVIDIYRPMTGIGQVQWIVGCVDNPLYVNGNKYIKGLCWNSKTNPTMH